MATVEDPCALAPHDAPSAPAATRVSGACRGRHDERSVVALMAATAARLARALHLLSAWMLGAIVLVNFVNVLGRYVFGRPVESADEVMALLLSSALFLTFARSTLEGAHIRMDLVQRILGGDARWILELFVNGLVCSLCLFIAYLGVPTVVKLAQWGQVSDVIKLPMWIPHSLVPFSFGLAGVLLLCKLVVEVCTWPRKEHQA